MCETQRDRHKRRSLKSSFNIQGFAFRRVWSTDSQFLAGLYPSNLRQHGSLCIKFLQDNLVPSHAVLVEFTTRVDPHYALSRKAGQMIEFRRVEHDP